MNLANKLTILRILLIPVVICALVYYDPARPIFLTVGIAAFFVACVTDGVDGYVARRFDQKTELGSYIDPIADKLLILSAFVALSYLTHLPLSMRIPAWVTIAVVSRDILIVVGSAVIYLTTGSLKAEPLFVGKLTTVLQMATLFLSLASAPERIRTILFISTVLLTLLSGLLYIRAGARIIQRTHPS